MDARYTQQNTVVNVNKRGKCCWPSQTLAIHQVMRIKVIWLSATIQGLGKRLHASLYVPVCSQPSTPGLFRYLSIRNAGLQWFLVECHGIEAWHAMKPYSAMKSCPIRKSGCVHRGSRTQAAELKWRCNEVPSNGTLVYSAFFGDQESWHHTVTHAF